MKKYAMASAIITSMGQVTIPVGVRSDLGLGTGERIDFDLNGITGRYELVPATKSVKSLKGLVGKPVSPVAVDDMNASIAARCSHSIHGSSKRVVAEASAHIACLVKILLFNSTSPKRTNRRDTIGAGLASPGQGINTHPAQGIDRD